MKGAKPMTKDMIIRREKTRRAVAIITLIAVMLSAFATAGAGKAYAADGTITLKVGRVIDYSSHFTHYFYAGDKDSPVYCSQPQLPPPEAGTYAYDFISPDSMLAKCLYYGYGGPGFEDYTDKQLRGEWDGDDDAYALTHIVISIAYDKTTSADSDPFRGLTESWKKKAQSLYNYIKTLPDPPANYRAYRIRNNGKQDILGSFNDVGTIKLKKASANPEMSAENSCYSLSGAKYGVYYGGKLCYTMTTDVNGACTLDNVLAADYTVKEISASKGFAVDVSSYNCKVKNEQTTDVAVTEVPKNNPVSLMLQKGDKETGKAEPQGGAKLEGAVYEIKYYKHKDGSTSLDRTWRVVTDDEGKANLSEEYLDNSFENSEFYLDSKGSICLPLGTVTIQEVKAPEGYLLNEKVYTDEIAEVSETIETVSTFNEPVIGTNDEMAEQVKRGDIQLVKVRDGVMTRLPNVQFRITSKTTGESHVVCTDDNGMIDTSAGFNSHKEDTNGGSAESGLWFGEIDVIDDEKGALIYDCYYLNELRGESNEGLKLAKDVEFRIYKDNMTVNLGTVTDDVVSIGTTAKDSDTENHISLADNRVTIIDTVKYKNFTPGKAYRLVGTLMDKDTGEPVLVSGKPVTSEKEFTPKDEDGTVDVTFTFDGSSLSGTDVVVFEKAYDIETETEITSHEDISDEGQTVSIPEIGTKATAADGKTNVIKPEKDQRIVDTVAYKKLIPGEEYELTTWLTKDGKKIWGTEVTKKFTAKEAYGTVQAELTFDASRHGGEDITVFEEVSLDRRLVAEHKDKDDKDQTVTVSKPAPDSPKTGDESSLLIWIAIAVIAAGLGGFITAREVRKRKDRE